MSTLTLRCALGDLPVLSGYQRTPANGVWAATVECHSEDPAPPDGSPASLAFSREDGAEDVWAGTIRRAVHSDGAEQLVVDLVGGLDKLSAELDPAEHVTGTTPVPVGLILRALVDAAGERLAPGVEAALDAFTVPRWHRAGGTSGRAAVELLLADVAQVEGVELGWRFLPDGSLWAGVETWAAAAPVKFIAPDLDDGVEIFGPDGAALQPGTTVNGQRAVEVLYTLIPPALRARVRHAIAGDPRRRLEVDLYRASYPATVKAQNADGTLNVTCDDDRIGDLRSVPFRLGMPGATATIRATARVCVRFESASPRGAYACDVDQDATATHPLALVSDRVVIGWIGVVAPPGGGSCSVTFIPFPGPPPIDGSAAAISGVISGPGHKFVKGIAGP